MGLYLLNVPLFFLNQSILKTLIIFCSCVWLEPLIYLLIMLCWLSHGYIILWRTACSWEVLKWRHPFKYVNKNFVHFYSFGTIISFTNHLAGIFFNEETYRDAQSLKQMQLVYIYIYLCLYALHQNPIQRHLYILCFSRRDSCICITPDNSLCLHFWLIMIFA